MAGAIALGPSIASAQAKYKNEAELVAAVMPAFVDIYIRKVDSDSGTTPIIEDDVGSGFIVTPEGVICTNKHVIEGAYSISVKLQDGRYYPAKLVGKALSFDIAFIKVDVGRPLPVAAIGDSDKVAVGERVVAIGNPWGHPDSVSSGVISALHRSAGMSAYDDLMQVDAAINQGNSGGPLFNMNGEVIGVNEALYTRNSGGSIGIGFSIPINEVTFLAENVKKHGKPYIGRLGVSIQNVTPGMGRALGRPALDYGVIISEIAPDSSAEKGGLKVGDIILKIDDDIIRTSSALNRKVAASVDKTAKILVVRDDKETTIPVRILPATQDLWSNKMADVPKIASAADLGLTFSAKDKTPTVDSVVQYSLAWTAGIRPGDVIASVMFKPVATIEELEKEVHALRSKGANDAMLLLKGPTGARWVDLSVRE